MAVIIGSHENHGVLSDELLDGNVIVAATNTVYGFIAKCTSMEGYTKIFNLKDRPHAKKLPILVSNFEDFMKYSQLSTLKKSKAKKFLDAGETVVVKLPLMWHAYFQGYKTAAFRIPKGPILDVINVVGPCWATSVNMAGEKPVSDPEVINVVWGEHIGFILTNDHMSNKPSNIIDLTGVKSKIIRGEKKLIEKNTSEKTKRSKKKEAKKN